MHDEATNLPTDGVFDPNSHQPAYQAHAVCVEAAPRAGSESRSGAEKAKFDEEPFRFEPAIR